MESMSTSMRSGGSCTAPATSLWSLLTHVGRGNRAGTCAEPRCKAGDQCEWQGCCYRVSLLLSIHLMEEV